MRKRNARVGDAGESLGKSPRKPRTVLVALCGQSPAVITETVWCLSRENPPTIPDEVVVITTSEGQTCVQRDLLESGAWQRLRRALSAPPNSMRFGATSSIHIAANTDGASDTPDIAGSDASAEFANLALRVLRGYTETPGMRVIFSIAGGRKSMSAIGALCMALLGRENDRLCHVLINEPYDKPLEPPFLFPEPRQKHRLGNGEMVTARPSLNLHDIPFPRCRNLFADRLERLPERFDEYVAAANLGADAAAPVNIAIDPTASRPECRVNGKRVKLGFAEFVLFWFLCERRRQGEPEIAGQENLSDLFTLFAAELTFERIPDLRHHDGFSTIYESNMPMIKLVNRLKSQIEAALPDCADLASCLPSPARGRYGLNVPASHITIGGKA